MKTVALKLAYSSSQKNHEAARNVETFAKTQLNAKVELLSNTAECALFIELPDATEISIRFLHFEMNEAEAIADRYDVFTKSRQAYAKEFDFSLYADRRDYRQSGLKALHSFLIETAEEEILTYSVKLAKRSGQKALTLATEEAMAYHVDYISYRYALIKEFINFGSDMNLNVAYGEI